MKSKNVVDLPTIEEKAVNEHSECEDVAEENQNYTASDTKDQIATLLNNTAPLITSSTQAQAKADDNNPFEVAD